MPAYRPLVDRFIEKFELDPETGCWNWTASIGTKGYGKFQTGNHTCMDAHKVSFEIFMGCVPHGKELHHICNNRKCVNPNHLEVTSHLYNCQWTERRKDFVGCLPHRLGQFKPYGRQWTDEQIKAYWHFRDLRRLARNKKVTGRPPKPLFERFARMLQLDWETNCWNWLGSKGKGGYGRLHCRERAGNTNPMAHRVAYELLVGEIPADMTIDHMCRNTRCCNPIHLRVVTRSENSDGGWVKAMREKTQCAKGHPFNELNTIPRKLHGKIIGRYCRVCRTHGPAKDELLIKLGLPLED